LSIIFCYNVTRGLYHEKIARFARALIVSADELLGLKTHKNKEDYAKSEDTEKNDKNRGTYK